MDRKVKINYVDDCAFSKAPVGTIFTWCEVVYMKIDTVCDKEDTSEFYNAVRLEDGDLCLFEDDDALEDNFKFFTNVKEIIIG